MGKKGKKSSRLSHSETPLYDQLVVETGIVPHLPPSSPDGWRGIPDRMLEDNFS